MHLLARLPRGTDDVELVARLARQGIAVTPLSTCGLASPYAPGLVIGFTNIETKKAPEAARCMARAMAECRCG
jgi:GntR family transcriptional regulator / MocR family aminotransferase